LRPRFANSLLLALVLAVGAPPAAAAEPPARPEDAQAAIEQAHGTFKELLAKQVAAGSKDERELNARVAAEFRALFDVRALAEKALSAHWGKMTEDQRQRVAALLETLIHRSYVKQLRAHAQAPVAYEPPSTEDGSVRVKTVITIQEGGRPADVHVDYLLARTAGGWRVWDLITDGVSVLKTYRSQFNRVIAKDGVDGLIARLQKKVDSEPAGSEP
jgi:phospholipid transport system substrate-binding protein